MANTFSYQVLSDTHRKAVIKLDATLDALGETSNNKILGRNLYGALAVDANNMVLVTRPGAVPRANYAYTIARVTGNVNIPNGYAQLFWDGTTPGTILNLSGSFDYALHALGTGVINNNAIVPNGNVKMTTVGSNANSSYSIILELHKDGKDFSIGQERMPSDFNAPPFTPKP